MITQTTTEFTKAFDVFCNIGGLTYGLQQSGINVTAGLDLDESCRYAYEKNCQATFIHADVKDVKYSDISPYLNQANVRILVGCAPCQPFSAHAQKYTKRNQDSRWTLTREFLRIIDEGRPEIVSMENVPTFLSTSIYSEFAYGLKELGYFVAAKVVGCHQFGLPQRRRRLILLASLIGSIELPEPSLAKPVTVQQAIGHLAPLAAGQVNCADPMHICSSLSLLNQKRMRASIPGGSWKDWPSELLPDCYKRASGKTYKNVYGRMCWDEPAPTLTTQFYRYGSGRFGHPAQDRALSLREGAILQSFPQEYEFVAPEHKLFLSIVGRHIGNAVPPLLGHTIGKSILNHLNDV